MTLELLGPKRRALGRIQYLTNQGWLMFSRISEISGIPSNTLRTRMLTYGVTDPRVLDPNYLPRARDYTRVKPHPWDRKRCRRNGLNCTQYGECQAQRLRISATDWQPPENTDICYRQTSTSHLWKYRSSLANFGAINL